MTIKEKFDAMDYGLAPENAAEALAWLIDQGDRFGHFINGSFTPPRDGFDSCNPATGEVLATLSQATQDDVDAAVKSARLAQPKWEKLGGPGRARHLYAIARLLQKHARLFAVLETLDNGKPIRESRDIDIPLAQRHFYYHAGMAQLMESELPEAQALGVCGQIIPWNFPLLMLAWKVAPALAMGNTVVLKPAEYTSLTALLFADICQQAGLPKGVVNIVTGDGAVGEMIVAADVDKIAFTGSTSVGRHIRAATAGTGKALTLELGGKSPYIIAPGADLEAAVKYGVEDIMINSAQTCSALTRMLVPKADLPEIEQLAIARANEWLPGDPQHPDTMMGPLSSKTQQGRVLSYIETGISEGATLLCGGTSLPEALAKGAYVMPTIFSNVTPDMAVALEEIFGPVLCIMPYETLDDAIAMANDTVYGLSSAVYAKSKEEALSIAMKLKAGQCLIQGAYFNTDAPFGGYKQSGNGREGGAHGLKDFMEVKSITGIPA